MEAEVSHKIIEQIKENLARILPGFNQQKLMSPVDSRAYSQAPKDHRKAAVMLLMYPEGTDWRLIYIQRTSHNPNDRHAGQISFPGGKLDDDDNSYLACALREVHEEIGVKPSSIHILGALSPLYVYVSNFLVYPFIGWVDHKPNLVLQVSEVESILSPTITHLTDPAIRKRKDLKVRDVVLKDIPYYDLHGKVLWGATAMITSEFLTILEQK